MEFGVESPPQRVMRRRGIMSEFLDKAITAHSAWKGRLRNAIESGQAPDVASIRPDNHCDLGKWIYGDGACHQHLPEFQELKSQHAKFHQAAADMVEMIRKGDTAKARNDLDAGAFAGASMKVITAIANLRKKLN